MSKFVIQPKNPPISSINRTIRISVEMFDRLTELSEKNGISFNKLVEQCIGYALENLDEENG